MTPILDPASPGRPHVRGRVAAVAALLAAAAVVLYLPTLRHAYVFDDEAHLSGNPIVLGGLGARGVRWAFTTLSGTSWHPLTWLSYMATVEICGPGPGPQHAAGFLLHALNAALLLAALFRMTGALGRSALVAALFALHPLHVESVAWAAMRKDVLYASFWTLSLLAYARYARRPDRAACALVAGTFALSLMSKPMAVTLPLVLLVLDGWPLGRMGGGRGRAAARSLLLDKAPLLALAAGVALLTVIGGVTSDVLVGLDALPLGARLKNVPVSYLRYLVGAACPAGLAVYYPSPPAGPPAWAWLSASAALAGVTGLALRERRRRPWFLAGWAWYVVTLLPVVGFLPIGAYARADRYTYLPLIGIFVIAAWGGDELFRMRRRGVTAPAAVSLLVVALMAAAARVQVAFWKDPVALFGHALAVTEGNWLAHYGVAESLAKTGETAAAEEHYRAAIQLKPGYKEARNNLGVLLARRGDLEGALEQFSEAIRTRPLAADLHYNVGVTLERLGRDAEAAEAFRKTVELEPGNAESLSALERIERQAPRPRP